MSSRDQETAAAIARAAAALDGALLGLGTAMLAAASWAKYHAAAAALRRVAAAPDASIPDLRSLLRGGGEGGKEGRLVVVRGQVQVLPSAKVLVSPGSGEHAAVVKQTQTCLYNEWRGIFGWTFDLHALFAKSWKEQYTTSFRWVPFALVEYRSWKVADLVNVKLDGATQPIPLTTVYHKLVPVQASPYTIFQAILGNGYPVALLDEEKILPVGKEITAIGFCRTSNGSLEISSCPEIPFFLSEMTKGELEAELATHAKTLFWSSIVLGTISVGLMGYAIYKNWGRVKLWMEKRRRTRELQEQAAEQEVPEDDSDDVQDGQLCVICLTRRRRSAFAPCGHLVCCPSCALTVERESSPLCPLCRQCIQFSIRIYDS